MVVTGAEGNCIYSFQRRGKGKGLSLKDFTRLQVSTFRKG